MVPLKYATIIFLKYTFTFWTGAGATTGATPTLQSIYINEFVYMLFITSCNYQTAKSEITTSVQLLECNQLLSWYQRMQELQEH